MTASRLSAPGGGTLAGALQRGEAPASKRPGKAGKRRTTGGRRQTAGLRRQTLPAAASSALTQIRDFAATLKGGWTEAGDLLGVSKTTVRRAVEGTYPTVPHRLLEAWARHRAAHPDQPATYLLRVVRLGRFLVAGRYFTAPGLERLNGRQVVLRPDGEHRFVVHADQPGHPLQVIGLAVTWAEAQALQPANPHRTVHQGENT